MVLHHFGEFVEMKLKMLIADSFCVFASLKSQSFGKMENGLANVNWDAVDNGVIEGGGQCVGVEKDRVVEGSHTLDVRFQCVDGWD